MRSHARRVTDVMFVAAARVLSEFSPASTDSQGSLYPPLERVREIARAVAFAVGREAQVSGLASATSNDMLDRKIAAKMWQLDY